jgi:alpha-mannosidase
VKFDQHGNITSIASVDDPSYEFVEPGKLANLFQIFEDKPLNWNAWDIDAFALETGQDLLRSESFEIVERGSVRVAAELVKSFGNSRIRQRISLGPTPGIRFDTEIDWHENEQLLKVAFPVNVHSSRATYEIQFGHLERPTHKNTSWDMAKFEVCAQKWVDLSEAGQGVALLNNGKYGHDIEGNVMRISLLRAPNDPDPYCDRGPHRFTYVLLPHFDRFDQADVVAAAYALNAPVRYAWCEPRSGSKAELPRFIGCDNRNLVIESVKKAEDSSKLVVRIYECHGSRGKAELTCLRNLRAAELCTLDEKALADLEVQDGSVAFEFKPFEIVTILLSVD